MCTIMHERVYTIRHAISVALLYAAIENQIPLNYMYHNSIPTSYNTLEAETISNEIMPVHTAEARVHGPREIAGRVIVRLVLTWLI